MFRWGLALALGMSVRVQAAVPGAPSTAAAPLACAGSTCRSEAVHARLMLPDGNQVMQVDFASAPYVSDGAIVMFPGETLVFRFSGGSGGPGAPVFEKQMAIPLPQEAPPSEDNAQSDPNMKVSHDDRTGEDVYFIKSGSPFLEGGTAKDHLTGEPPNTVIVSYHQVMGRPDMVLRVDHNFAMPLKYDAVMQRITPNGPAATVKTSTCPVQPMLTGSETWPYPLGAMVLKNFRFIDTSQGFNCD